MQRRQLNRLVPGTIRLVGVGTGVEPATSRSIIWCSAIELTNVDVPWSDPIHGTGSAKPCRVTYMPLDRQHQRTGERQANTGICSRPGILIYNSTKEMI